jgi:hypothetical protein
MRSVKTPIPSARWHQNARERWQALLDRSLSLLVVLLLIDVLLLPPLVEMRALERHWLDILSVLIVTAGALTFFERQRLGWLYLLSALALIAVRTANFWLPDEQLRRADALLAAINHALLAALTLIYTFSPGGINVHRVLGSVAGYLLIGLVFVQLHRLVAMIEPGAYLLLGQPVGYDTLVPKLTYFSFVVLTSTGFGDITPAGPVARAVTTAEFLLGAVYTAAVISWMVALATLRRDGGN